MGPNRGVRRSQQPGLGRISVGAAGPAAIAPSHRPSGVYFGGRHRGGAGIGAHRQGPRSRVLRVVRKGSDPRPSRCVVLLQMRHPPSWPLLRRLRVGQRRRFRSSGSNHDPRPITTPIPALTATVPRPFDRPFDQSCAANGPGGPASARLVTAGQGLQPSREHRPQSLPTPGLRSTPLKPIERRTTEPPRHTTPGAVPQSRSPN
jgi:hypothetical protein